MGGNLEVVRILLKNGADVNALNTRISPSIARYAASPERAEVAMNRPGWTWTDADQATPLHLAAAFCADPALLQTLIQHGTNVNARSDDQATPLHRAAVMSAHPEVISTLARCGADVNAFAVNQLTPLNLAELNPTPAPVIEALIHCGAYTRAAVDSRHSTVTLLLKTNLGIDTYRALQ